MASNLGTVLCGRRLAYALCQQMKADVSHLKTKYGIFPRLAMIEVGDRQDFLPYVTQKKKIAARCDITLSHIRLSSRCREPLLLDTIHQLNEDPTVHGIMIQLPIQEIDVRDDMKIDVFRALNAISSVKDVEGLGYVNSALLSRERVLCHTCGVLRFPRVQLPCTAAACFAFIRQVGFPLQGSRCVVIGRGRLVGAPMADLLTLSGRATVTQCHIYTNDLAEEVNRADLVVAAAGHPELIRGDWIKEGALVLDCGYSFVSADTLPSKYRSVGDVQFSVACHRAGWITPVPGGLGPVSVSMLFQNTLRSAQWSLGLDTSTCECGKKSTTRENNNSTSYVDHEFSPSVIS